ncbi:MAG: MoaD/ThiS family protein [Symploca sp. SIO2D2]|nr:MoaD/ThiS family protein [Symploca sp. SIO2D2]
MTQPLLTITVKLFAAYQDVSGVPEMKLEFPGNTPVSAVQQHLLAKYPELEPWRNLTRFGINLQFVEPDTILQDGDEVVLVPPVNGG